MLQAGKSGGNISVFLRTRCSLIPALLATIAHRLCNVLSGLVLRNVDAYLHKHTLAYTYGHSRMRAFSTDLVSGDTAIQPRQAGSLAAVYYIQQLLSRQMTLAVAGHSVRDIYPLRAIARIYIREKSGSGSCLQRSRSGIQAEWVAPRFFSILVTSPVSLYHRDT